MEFVTHRVTYVVACQAASTGDYVIVTELSDLLNSTGISARQAAEKADEIGVELPYGTITGYWAGRHPIRPTEKTLLALAEVTALPVRRLRRAVGMATGEAKPWTPPPEANRLSNRQRVALERLIKAIVTSESVDESKSGQGGLTRAERQLSRKGIGIEDADNRHEKRS